MEWVHFHELECDPQELQVHLLSQLCSLVVRVNGGRHTIEEAHKAAAMMARAVQGIAPGLPEPRRKRKDKPAERTIGGMSPSRFAELQRQGAIRTG